MFKIKGGTMTKTLNIEMNKETKFDVVQMIMETRRKEEVTVAMNDLKRRRRRRN